MAKQLQLRRGTTSQHSTFTGANGEVTIDTDKKVVVVHDGVTAGGIPLAKQATVDTKVAKVVSTDNAIVRFDGTTGDVQNSGVVIDDNGNVIATGSITSIRSDIKLSLNDSAGSLSSMNGASTLWKPLSLLYGTGSFIIKDASADAERMRIDANGNVGIGVTPSAWHSNISAIDFGYDGYLYSRKPGDGTNLGSNSYTDNDTTWKYKNTWYATRYEQLNGTHKWYTAPSGTAGNVIPWTTAMTLDASGNLLLTSGTGALGYGTGAGGTVTQLTSKSTAVTLNKPSGYITMNGAALAAGATVTFIFNNSIISYSDQILITRATTGTTAGYNVWIDSVGAGACTIAVKNITGVSLSEAIVLSYSIIKGAGA